MFEPARNRPPQDPAKQIINPYTEMPLTKEKEPGLFISASSLYKWIAGYAVAFLIQLFTFVGGYRVLEHRVASIELAEEKEEIEEKAFMEKLELQLSKHTELLIRIEATQKVEEKYQQLNGRKK